jgi:hypothetical protein
LDLTDTPLDRLAIFQTVATSSRHARLVKVEETEDIGFSQRLEQCNQKSLADGKHPLKRF